MEDNRIIKGITDLYNIIDNNPQYLTENLIARTQRKNPFTKSNWNFWHAVCRRINFSEDFIDEFAEFIDWDVLVIRQPVPEYLLNKYENMIDETTWTNLSACVHYNLSDGFIKQHYDKLNLLTLSETNKYSHLFETCVPDKAAYNKLTANIKKEECSNFSYATKKPYFNIYVNTPLKIKDTSIGWEELFGTNLVSCKETLAYYLVGRLPNKYQNTTVPKYYTIVIKKKLKKIHDKRRKAIHRKMNSLLRKVARSVGLPKPKLISLENNYNVMELLHLSEDSPWLRSKATVTFLALTLQRGMVGAIAGKRSYNLKSFEDDIKVSGWRSTVVSSGKRVPRYTLKEVRKLIKENTDLVLKKRGLYHNGIVTALKSAKMYNML